MFGEKFYSFVFDVDEQSIFWMNHQEVLGRQGFEVIRTFSYPQYHSGYTGSGTRVRIKCRLISKIGRFRSFKSSNGPRFMTERYEFTNYLVAIKFFE